MESTLGMECFLETMKSIRRSGMGFTMERDGEAQHCHEERLPRIMMRTTEMKDMIKVASISSSMYTNCIIHSSQKHNRLPGHDHNTHFFPDSQ